MFRIVDMRPATASDKAFSVWDTIHCEFLTVDGDQSWDGVEQFLGYVKADDLPAGWMERILALLPDWAGGTNGAASGSWLDTRSGKWLELTATEEAAETVNE